MPKQPRTTRRRRGHALIVSGYGVRIHVSRGRLVVTDGIGEDRQERVYPRVGQNIGRVVMLAQDGSISLAAVRWLTGLGIPYLHLDRDGRLLAESAQARLDDPRLRRAQALAGTSPVGIAVARELITRKIRGQRSVLDHLGGDPTTIDPSLELALAASSLDEVRRAESTAALAYWASWSGLAVRFHRRDQDSVPAHWRRFVRRGSDITGNPRSATDPTNAILNYLYAILEAGRGESIQVSSGEGDRSRSARPLATNRGVDPMGTSTPKIVSPEEWEAARAALLVKEKEVTRARDALAASRRRMPMVAVEKTYRFDGPDGPATLLDLFDGRRQLVLYRFFMDPNMSTYPERGCKGCSLGADQLGNLAHLRARDTNYVAVSRAAQEHLQRYRERMGWTFPWYTTLDDFSEDFGVAEWHGTNVFLRDDDDRIYRTYFVATAAMSMETCGRSWISPRMAGRRSGRTRPRAGHRRRRTSGGVTTISMSDRFVDPHDRTRAGRHQMSDKPTWRIARLDEMDRGGSDLPIREYLGIHAFGFNIRTPEHGILVNEHDEASTGQEELYVVLDGTLTFEIDGEAVEAKPGTLLSVAPQSSRKATGEGTVLVIGGKPGEAYQGIDWGDAWPFHRDSLTAYRDQRYADALHSVRDALEQMPDHPGLHYNYACFATLAGDTSDDTFAHLRRSVELFPRFREDARQDDDLAAVRDDPRFEKALS